MTLEKLDHLVLPVSDIEDIAMFYTTYLGMEKRGFGEGRVALHFGNQKINLHAQKMYLLQESSRAVTRLTVYCAFQVSTLYGAKHSPLASGFWLTSGGNFTLQRKFMKLNNFLLSRPSKWNPFENLRKAFLELT